jgi:hypothetical protein
MQTETRAIRIILAETFGKKHNDPLIVACADRIYTELTGKKNPPRDSITGWLEMGQAKTAEMQEITEILQTFERELRRADELSSKDTWREFARGFVRKELAAGRNYKAWLVWFRSDPKRMEWAWKETPETIRARWMMAFTASYSTTQHLPSGV